MRLLAVQSYVKVQRQIIDAEIVYKEEDRQIYLYYDRLVTKHREFPTRDISDLSFRKMGDEGGLLYVHTSRGIFSYTVPSSPESFIKAFRIHIKKEYF
ncbi:hypothetical protein J6TS1_15860 [Siminovitchia terrae]|uniref:Uncharacterized protein n=1 Tax=Siminovitchia terrae TaxID=1914933 RepID=A0A429X8G4_SIMTE|nr:hypothetical protein [Siminovitchia terrae]RST59738.1 hypothetical protein D5F11_009995 [Siminovitchia terrae]GIN91625.1 hypothetical protein J22TS1_26760 [Siminovitchia terrae]GIN95716.1 hypothetical protein J6TS1_15860 [Siminovitchia terrae]